uniref:transcription cofactor vestigial-like protein 1 n=1 Tax=Jaculus jaculus TaxID=51337 RepID=UPI001E1B3DFE|nr:transcription cofactor vestigial-like protein 1 [Jaculus jaculus]
MEEIKKTADQLPKGRQKPIKTEWNARCVLFTYFQGDIGSVVDEHFSRALSNIKRPEGLNPCSHSEEVLKNDGNMPRNQWRFSSPWTKPQLEASRVNGATTSSLAASGPKAVDQYLLSLPKNRSVQPEEMWHFSSPARPTSLEPGYSRAFRDRHLTPEPQSDRKCEPFLSLLQQDRYRNRLREPAIREDCNPVQIAGSRGLLLSKPHSSVHCKKMYASPTWGPASPRLAHESVMHHTPHIPAFWSSPLTQACSGITRENTERIPKTH